MAFDTTPTVLSIAGFDPSGGAGVSVDCKTIHAFGGYAMSVITAQTVQSPCGVRRFIPTDTMLLSEQIAMLFEQMRIDAVKIGMLAGAATIETVAKALGRYRPPFIVLDTVMVSSSGTPLISQEGISAMTAKLFPLATVITPNLDEVNRLLETNFEGKPSEVVAMAEGLFSLGAKKVLIKGGHTQEAEAVDYLVEHGNITRYAHPRVQTRRTRATGCVLSSGIAVGVAKGLTLQQSVKEAKAFLSRRMQSNTPLIATQTVDGCAQPLL